MAEGVAWGAAAAVLSMVAPGHRPSYLHGWTRVIGALVIWLTIATSIAVSRSKGIMVDQLRGPMSFIWRWWGVLLFFLFPIPLLIFWVVAGRPSLAGALAALVVLLLATVRVAFRNKRMPPS